MRNGRVTREFSFNWLFCLLCGLSYCGCSDAGDNVKAEGPPPPDRPEFVFPHEPGTIRQYHHNYIYDYIAVGQISVEKWGLLSWEVVSSNRTNEEATAVINFVRRDTVRERFYIQGRFLHSETTYVQVRVDSFLVRVLSDTIKVDWARTVDLVRPEVISLGNIPRFLNNPTDTIKMEQGSYSAWYVSGVGLVRFKGFCCGGHAKLDELLLLQPQIPE